MEQGSAEWHAARCGRATASRIADIIRRGRSGAVSASRQRYLGELVAERLTGIPTASFVSADMQRGIDLEEEAVAAYEFFMDAPTVKIGFVHHPTISMSGASPDRLVGEDGLLQVKCPATHTHIATLRGATIDPDYLVQMQWEMACSGRLWCDFASYDPRMPPDMRLHVERVHRSERIDDLAAAVLGFLSEVDEAIADLIRRFRTRIAAE